MNIHVQYVRSWWTMRSGCPGDAIPMDIWDSSRSLWWKVARSAKNALHGQTMKLEKPSRCSRSWLEKICSINWKAGRRPQYLQKVPWLWLIGKLVEHQQSLLKDQLHYFEELQQELQQPHHKGNRFSKQPQRHGRPASARTIMPKQPLRIFYYFLLFQTYQLNL